MMRRITWSILGAFLVLATLLALTLAVPIPLWRTGRLDAPPLDLIAGEPEVPRADRLWIDTDAACGASARTDPDDCLAVAWLASQNVDITGISTSFGNADADVVVDITQQLVAAIGRSGRSGLPLWRGSANPVRAGEAGSAPAHAALRAALAQGPLTIVALGPLTNIAAVLANRPELQRNVVRLVAVMGHRPGHLFHPSEGAGAGTLFGHGPIFRDLNFAKDPAAVRAVLQMRLPITLVPYDAARRVRITGSDLDSLEGSAHALAWAARRSRAWLRYWRESIGQPGFYPFDWVAAAYVMLPARFHCAKASAWIAEEWAFWLFPRTSLLVGPSGPVQESTTVVYCPMTNEALHNDLVSSTMR